jgi:2-polyprenyl-3-methyl-5-hydroxy-6-metoxy-1,4-benzoquinol methylase
MLNYYNRNAKQLFDKYQKFNPDELHAYWLKHLPRSPGLALDIGAGSGRDSSWLAKKGWKVIAVEPAPDLMELGKKFTSAQLVSWIDDCLPELDKLKKYRQKFSLILVSGVFMHLSQPQRIDSLETITCLMAESSVLVITLRHGPDSEGRKFYQVPADEIVQFAEKKSLHVEVSNTLPDKLKRNSVTWQTVIVKQDF